MSRFLTKENIPSLIQSPWRLLATAWNKCLSFLHVSQASVKALIFCNSFSTGKAHAYYGKLKTIAWDVLWIEALRPPLQCTVQKHVFICPNSFWTPLCRPFGHFVAFLFCRKRENSLNCDFDVGNEYFDSDYGQTWL